MEQTIFKLKGNKTPISYTINGGHNGRITTVHEGEKRAIRHVPSENTIFMNKQSPFAPKNAVSPVFYGGYAVVDNTDKSTIDYLRAHPLCNKVYEEINTSDVAKKSIERDEIVTQLKYEVREKSKEEGGKTYLEAIACVLTGSYIKTRGMGIEELKKEIYYQIDASPYRFVDEYNNSILFGPENIKRYLVHYAQNNGCIKVSENKKSWIWCDTGSLICNIPNGVMPIDHFCEFLDTDEGMIVGRKIHDMTGDVVGGKKSEVSSEKKKPGRPAAN